MTVPAPDARHGAVIVERASAGLRWVEGREAVAEIRSRVRGLRVPLHVLERAELELAAAAGRYAGLVFKDREIHAVRFPRSRLP